MLRVNWQRMALYTLICIVPVTVQAKNQHRLAVGGIYTSHWRDLHPTQFMVGQKEVELKKVEFLDEYARVKDQVKKLVDLYDENLLYVVIGPDNKLFCIDGHHKLRMFAELALESKITQEHVQFQVRDDLSDSRDMDHFWRRMQNRKYMFLKDKDGRLRNPEDLPTTILDLEDNPYRSLAWIVRKLGGFKDLEQPMQEFEYAELFGKYISTPPRTNEDYIVATHKALQILRTKSEARSLPGAIRPKKVIQCKSIFAVPVLASLVK